MTRSRLLLWSIAAALASLAGPGSSSFVNQAGAASRRTNLHGPRAPMPSFPLATRDFIDGEGVNTHIPYTDGAYANVAQIIADLKYLGISHVRDGLNSPGQFGGAPISAYETIARAGIQFTMMVGGGGSFALTGGVPTDPSLDQRIGYLAQLARDVPGSIAMVEGTNEINNQPIVFDGQGASLKGADELNAALAMQRALYAGVHADPVLRDVPVAYFTGTGAGSIPNGPDPLATPGLADYATGHPYPNGGDPPGRWVARAQALGNVASPTAPAVYTETGYSSNGGTAGAVNADVQAKYTLDLLLDTTASGIAQTDLYELLDAYAPGSRQGDAGYGLFDSTGKAKPVATAIHAMNAILAANAAAPSTFSPTPLAVTFGNEGATAHHLVMQNADESYIVALWDEQPIWDAAHGTQLAPSAHTVSVSLSGIANPRVVEFDPMQGTAAVATMQGASQSVTVTDHPVFLLVVAGADATGTDVAGTPPPAGGSKDTGPQATPASSGGSASVAGAAQWLVTPAGAATSLTLADGADSVTSFGRDTIIAGDGRAVVYAAGASVSVQAGAGPLVFVGGSGPASVSGGAGSCTVFAGTGGGRFSAGGAGSSILVAATGNTTLQGAAQGDVLFGSPSGDGGTTLAAGAGAEVLVGGAGPTTVVGGSGGAIVFVGSAATLFVSGQPASSVEAIVGFKPGLDHLAVHDPSGVLASARHGAWGTSLTLGNDAGLVVFGLLVGASDLVSPTS